MKRSAALLLVALSALLSGCNAGFADGPSTPVATETTPERVANETTVEYLDVESNLDSREEPIELQVRNTGNESQTVVVGIERDGDLVFRRTFELGHQATITGTVDHEDAYTITIERDGQREVTEIKPEWFDCNSKTISVSVGEADVDSTWRSTLAACQNGPVYEIRDFLGRLVP